ncbi:MAG TPA: LacI family DNA-binding transcriptional regulator [Glycomyces sp.]|nr:LacI family DNA-binding transcriptional regulator [Glycomyces sp.]
MTPSENPPTLRDVSAATGFSIYTVSRALRNLSGVSEATRAQVIAAASRLGYVPNRSAQTLKRRSSTTIGILTANNANPFYSTLVNGFEDVVVRAGYHCIVSDATDHGEYSRERESRFLEDLLQQRVAAVALTYQPGEDQLKRLLEWPMPLVFMDSHPPRERPDAPSVVVDGEAVSYEVGRHFAEHGYRDWLFVGHPQTWTTRGSRQAGFARAAEAFGATLTVVEGHNDPADSAAAVHAAFEGRSGPFRAVFAANEPLVIGTLRALRSLGLSVPGDVAIVGYDEFDWAEFAAPRMTVVDQEITRIGRAAGERILHEIERHGSEPGAEPAWRPEQPQPRARLIVRDSCGVH